MPNTLTLSTNGPTPNPLNVPNGDRSITIVNELNVSIELQLDPAGVLELVDQQVGDAALPLGADRRLVPQEAHRPADQIRRGNTVVARRSLRTSDSTEVDLRSVLKTDRFQISGPRRRAGMSRENIERTDQQANR